MAVTAPETRPAPARQQPDWPDATEVARVRAALSALPPLVRAGDVRALRAQLARVAAGEAQVVQAGDCAEDPAECTPGYVARKRAVLDLLAGAMRMVTHRPVVRVGRMAGQFAKPRSRPTEWCNGIELPVYRGHMVNGPEPDPAARRPDPERLLAGYRAASEAMTHLGWRPGGGPDGPGHGPDAPVWTSHEALLLDYELPMLRPGDGDRPLLASTHWPWIGERTRQVDGAHVDLLARVDNPVACKVGPGMTADELTALCERLDPLREPGRLTLIARMGAGAVADRLPPLVAAARASGHPVIWLCDPLHGNTVSTPDGVKTRVVTTVEREVREFQRAVTEAGGVAGGLHLETTPDDVAECVAAEGPGGPAAGKYTSFCDPRLNPAQAVSVVSAWRG
ncbi:3-deoxy-7-phosphoheptulonate synthase [Streptomyces sp. NPDC015131]|uniref:3-deoxy-7-phosphoheptulonate synthase n=1 Tax=Streptomyces sp. NPDC015131 TaxID=3364941 RepID=UPI0036F7BEDE